MKRILFLSLIMILGGCETLSPSMSAKMRVNAAVSGIIKAFDKSVPGGGIRGKSQNGRDIVSRYHPPHGDVYTNAITDKVRAYAKLTILGDRRPYDLELQYIIEERNEEGEYHTIKKDKAKAQKILKDLHTYLVTRPDRDNFIDDFRPF